MRSAKWFLGVVLAITLWATWAQGQATLEWSVKAFGDGRHNAFTDLISWHGKYYLCFRHGAAHLSMDGQIQILRSDDLKTWTPCGTLDTLGDDRDPHFTATDQRLYVFFGTWDLLHAQDNGLPGRGRLRSYGAWSENGEQWSDIHALYETGWWLWRVRWLKDAFYSVAYEIDWPSKAKNEARLLRSADGLGWQPVSTVTQERQPDEADFRFLPDGSMEVVMRCCDKQADSMWLKSTPDLMHWTKQDLGVVIHSPVLLSWKDRLFVAGRGREADQSVTRIWERTGDQLKEVFTLPSSGDTAYPGLLLDPATENASAPAFFVSWYSQHERDAGRHDEANVYAGRVVLK